MKNRNLHIKLIITFFVLSFMSSCALFHKKLKSSDVPTEENIKNEEVNNFINDIGKNNLKYKTFYTIFSGNFISNDKTFPLKGILKIKKDTFIQISIRPTMGIELAKILFTTDSIKYINRLKKEYLNEDYFFLQKKFGISLTYKMIESILTNKSFAYPAKNNLINYNLDFNEELDSTYFFNFKGVFYDKNMIHKLKFSQNNFNLLQNVLYIIKKRETVSVLYSDFYDLNQSNFPKNIKIKLNENQIKYKINILYKNIKLNKTLNSNFTIPKSYKYINFE